MAAKANNCPCPGFDPPSRFLSLVPVFILRRSNADNAENAYLGGSSYQLAGGGWLRPSYAGTAIAGSEDVAATAAVSGAAGMPPRDEVWNEN